MQALVHPRLFVWFVFFNPWSCSDTVDLLCFSFNLIIFYFISTLGIAVIINNEIFNNDPNGTPSMSLSNRTGTHIDAGRYTCYFDNSWLNSTNHTRFDMEANSHYLIVVCYLSDTFLLLCLLHVLNLVCFFFSRQKK